MELTKEYSTPKPINSQPAQIIPSNEEKTWASISHLCVLLNLFSGIIGTVATLIIFFVYKGKSKYIAYQSMQSFITQLICWLGALVAASVLWTIIGGFLSAIWTGIGMLSSFLIGILFIPLGIILTIMLVIIPIIFVSLPVVNLVYAIIGAIHCKDGKNFQYFLIGKWLEKYFLPVFDAAQ